MLSRAQTHIMIYFQADRLNAAIIDELNSKTGSDPHLKTSDMEVDKRRDDDEKKTFHR